MRAVQGKITLPANQAILVFSVPVIDLHNVVVKAGGSLSLGGKEISTGNGLGMENGDISAWSWQDFRSGDNTEILELYAVAAAETTLSFLIWRR